MTKAFARSPRRKLLVPQTVQTSAMDCGPAALSSLCAGFGLLVSYGRLREACQTGLDGTSVDTLEQIANRLGLEAEQCMLPEDHLALRDNPVLPAIMVTRLPDGPTHFVVVWRAIGRKLQVMDPAKGRRMVDRDDFFRQLYRHTTVVSAHAWREWAGSDGFLDPLRERLVSAGIDKVLTEKLIGTALKDPKWFRLAALDASLRLLTMMRKAGDIADGESVRRLLVGLYHRTCTHPDDIHTIIPADCWSVVPDAASSRPGEPMLAMTGAVLVRVRGVHAARPANDNALAGDDELATAIAEKPVSIPRFLLAFLTADGKAAPALLVAAVVLSAVLAMVEALMLRSLFDISGALNLPSQRLVAVLAVFSFLVLSAGMQFPIIRQTMQRGRALDVHLRMALLDKLPRLSDRFFQSRPISDMAERSHAIHAARMLPAMATHLVQLMAEMAFLVVGILVIDPMSALPVLCLSLAALAVPLIAQPLASESDLAVRNHSGALSTFYLDALTGVIPIRVHRAQKLVFARHAALLVEWSRASKVMMKTALTIGTLQQGLITLAILWLVASHFLTATAPGAADLLLLYWALKVPAVGQMIASLSLQYPAQRNILLRLMEPLATPDSGAPAPQPARSVQAGPLSIQISDGTVLAGGHVLLDGVNLSVQPGEQVAIVGPSGAGKSTLLGLLLGWHTLAEGHIAVDGRRLGPRDIEQLRHRFAWVDPSVMIWNRSLFDNLVFSSGIEGASRIGKALSDADLMGLVARLPDGIQSNLGEGGSFLSGGEAQRVRLARALIQSDPSLVLMDEPFRGLDRSQRQSLMQTCRSHWQGKTLLCVTHDITETLSFDRVIVVDNGRIVDDGSPTQLAQTPGRYRDLLLAEQAVAAKSWSGRTWRYLRLEGGRIHEHG